MSSVVIGQVRESFDSPEVNDADSALTKAQALNRSLYRRDFYGFAKAVCIRVNPQGNVVWKIRTLEISFPPLNQRNLIGTSLSMARSQLKVIYSGVFSSTETYKDKDGFSKLLDAVRGVIEFIHQKAQALIKPEEIRHKLNKLIIYLSQATSWPFLQEKNSIENVIRVFSDYSQSLLQGHLDPSNQIVFKKFVCSLNKALQEESISCYEIGIKILTKSKRNPKLQQHECERIKKLIKIGIERIHAPKRKQEMRGLPFEENVNFFCIAFALHAYVYKQGGDLERALTELTVNLDRLVVILCAYDRDHQRPEWPGVLSHFTFELLQYIEDRCSSKFYGKRDVAFLIWTLEVLVSNNRFIHYMRTQYIQKELIAKIAERLLFSEKAWKAAMAFLIGLADPKLFERVLKEKAKRSIGHPCGLSQAEIDTIFGHLNKRLFKCDCLVNSAYKAMYVQFLKYLDEYQLLHTLKPFAKHPDHQAILRHNLAEIGYDFVTESHVPLDAFFGQIAYQALYLHSTDMSHEVAQAPAVRRSIVTLFTHFNEERIGDLTAFKAGLVRLLSDFNEGLELFGEIAICAIGKSINVQSSMSSGNLTSVETWLSKTVIPLYDQIKKSVLECVPVKTSDSILVSNRIARQEKCLISALKKESVRKQVTDLAEAFVLFYNQDRFKTELDYLLRAIFRRISYENTLSFETHLFLLTEFMQALPLYFKRSDEQMRLLFYSKGGLHVDLVAQLFLSSYLLSLPELGKELHERLYRSELQQINPDTLKILSEITSSMCIEEFELAPFNCPLDQMGRIPFRFLEIERGRVWEYSIGDWTLLKELRQRQLIDQFVSRGRSILSNLLGRVHLELVHSSSFPFVWPSQVLALALVLEENNVSILSFLNNNSTNNAFLKMGIGQGKSTFTAIIATKESLQGCVFVLTRYPHLAKQGYAVGKVIFDRENVESLCISEPCDSLNFSAKYRIIYTDIESLDATVKELMLKMFQEVATSDEIDFLRLMYGLAGEIRIILDEYDLILDYDKQKVPSLEQISAELMPYDPKANFQHSWPLLEQQIRADQAPVSDAKAEKKTGEKKFFQKGYFHLPLHVWRLSKFLKNAKRVIGLASTANQDDVYLNPVAYYAIPYLQNTSLSTMPIQGVTPCPPNTSAIICRKKINFDFLKKDSSLYIVEENVIQSYCSAILEDIEAVRQERLNTPFPYRRPILILADPNFSYKNPESSEVKTLWEFLKTAFEKAALPFEELTETSTLGIFQKIGKSGSITLSAVKYGFGTDIQVDPVIEEGLHVIVATSVPQPKFLEHMIGRAGRMGGQGSYSAITIGRLISPAPKSEDRSGFYEALHQITALFVKRLTSSDAQVELRREWLLFLGRTYANGRQIDEQAAQALCGAFYQRVVAGQYLSNLART